MKNEKGFAKIVIIIGVFCTVLILSGATYLGIEQYNINKFQKVENERIQQEKEHETKLRLDEQQKALEGAQKKIEELSTQAYDVQNQEDTDDSEQRELSEQLAQKIEDDKKIAVQDYISAIQNTYIPERTRFYKIDNCLYISGEFKTEKDFENCIRQVWIEESAMLPSVNSLFDSIPVPSSMMTYAATEKLFLYSYALCRENQIKQYDSEITNFNVGACNDRTFEIFEQARNEMARVKSIYGL